MIESTQMNEKLLTFLLLVQVHEQSFQSRKLSKDLPEMILLSFYIREDTLLTVAFWKKKKNIDLFIWASIFASLLFQQPLKVIYLMVNDIP